MSLRFLILLIAILLAAAVRADEAGTPGPGDSQRMLVLNSGEIIRGRMTTRSDGYDVDRGSGKIFVASDQIRFEASSFGEAWQKMRKSFPELTPAAHMTIARWCVNNRQPDEARREVLDALHLDPSREDARSLLRMLERDKPSSGVVTPQSSSRDPVATPVITRGSGGGSIPGLSQFDIKPGEIRTLGGLPRPVAAEFVQRVQPLLSNKCAAGNCHGGNKSSFVLSSVRRGSTPLIAEKNLAAVLAESDSSDPDNSPLLRFAKTPHGGNTLPLFPGRGGAVQLESLRAWMASLGAEAAQATAVEEQFGGSNTSRPANLPPDPEVSETASIGPARDHSKNQNELQAAVFESGAKPNAPSDTTSGPHGRQRTLDETDAQFLNEARRSNRRDAFDPRVFNQNLRGRNRDVVE